MVSADFPNLNIETIVNAKKLGCDIYGIYLQDDLDSAEKLKNIGVSTNFAINASDNNKSLKPLVLQLSNITQIDKLSSGLEELTQIPGLINVWGINGSPGRTTTAINLAFSLANKNSPTLLIDLDAVAPSIAASLGIGVAFSALAVGVYQGLFTILGFGLGDVLNEAQVIALTVTGGLLLVGVSFRLLKIKQLPVADLLPALFYAPILVALVTALR